MRQAAASIFASGSILLAFLVQALVALIPLLLVPILGRRLGVEGFGLFAIAQAFSIYVMAVGEFGFSLSGSRAVAANRDNVDVVATMLADVSSAKLIVAAAILAPLCLAFLMFPMVRDHLLLFGAATVFGLGQGFSLYWLFGGQQRQRLGSLLDLGARLSAAIAIFFLVHSPDDGAIAMLCFACAQLVWVAISYGVAYRNLPFKAISLRGGVAMLKTGRYVFMQNAVGIMYNASTTLVMGLVASPTAIGLFSGAERLARSPLMLMTVVRQVLFPVMVSKLAQSTTAAIHFWRLMLGLAVAGGVATGLLLFLAAPFLVRVMLGPDFSDAVAILQLLSPLPLIAGIGEVFSVYWLLPMHRDQQLTLMVVGTTLLHVFLVLVLAAHGGAAGTVAAVLASQFVAMAASIALVMYAGADPLRRIRTA